MEIVLVRHALPLRVELESGIADPELGAEGHEQAAKMAAYLGTEDIEAIFVSPLRRAIETARPLEQRLGITAEVVDGVAEFDRNSREYVPMEELRAANDPRWEKLMRGEEGSQILLRYLRCPDRQPSWLPARGPLPPARGRQCHFLAPLLAAAHAAPTQFPRDESR